MGTGFWKSKKAGGIPTISRHTQSKQLSRFGVKLHFKREEIIFCWIFLNAASVATNREAAEDQPTHGTAASHPTMRLQSRALNGRDSVGPGRTYRQSRHGAPSAAAHGGVLGAPGCVLSACSSRQQRAWEHPELHLGAQSREGQHRAAGSGGRPVLGTLVLGRMVMGRMVSIPAMPNQRKPTRRAQLQCTEASK